MSETMSETKKKLTDFQLRLVQIVAGVLSAAALVISIWVSNLKAAEDNALLKWLFLIVFLVLVIGRRKIESRYQLRLNLYGVALIDGILAGVIFYAVMLFYFPGDDVTLQLSDTLKLVIIAGVSLALVIFGVLLPLLKYSRRKAEGTLPPIRIEKKEEPVTDDKKDDAAAGNDGGSLTIEQQIAAMTAELDDKTESNDQK